MMKYERIILTDMILTLLMEQIKGYPDYRLIQILKDNVGTSTEYYAILEKSYFKDEKEQKRDVIEDSLTDLFGEKRDSDYEKLIK